jgi:hypothetical protein
VLEENYLSNKNSKKKYAQLEELLDSIKNKDSPSARKGA